jgi:hypothetical protein
VLPLVTVLRRIIARVAAEYHYCSASFVGSQVLRFAVRSFLCTFFVVQSVLEYIT